MRNAIQQGPVTWIDISDPSEEDTRYLQENFHFHPVTLQEIVPQSLHAKVEAFPDYLFLILYFPVYNKEKKETRSREIDIIVSRNTLITSHYNSILPLKSVYDDCNLYEEKRAEWMGQGTGMLLARLLEEMGKSCVLKLHRVNQKLDQIEREIFSGKEREMLREILLAKADIIDFFRIITPQQRVLESFKLMAPDFFGAELEPYFSHLAGLWDQVKNDLETYKDTIFTLEQTNNSLLSHRTNETLKVLTVFSVIIFPLTLFATLFSMKTHSAPLTGFRGDFWVIVGIMFLIAVGMIRYFKKKDWL